MPLSLWNAAAAGLQTDEILRANTIPPVHSAMGRVLFRLIDFSQS